MSNEKITSVNGMRLHGGSILIAGYIKSIGIEESLDTLLPKAGKSRGYKPSQKILAFISSLILLGYGRYVNTLRLRKDIYSSASFEKHAFDRFAFDPAVS